MKILLIVLFTFLQVSDDDRSIPSMNYWDLWQALLNRPHYQQQVEVTEEELRKLKSLQIESSPEMAVLLKKEAWAGALRGMNAREKLVSKYDTMVLEKLQSVLPASKLAMLRYVALNERFPCSYLPFRDAEVLEYCEVPKRDQAKVRPLATKQQMLFGAERTKELTVLASSLLESLPEASKKLFVEFAGPDLLPGEPRNASAPIKRLPLILERLSPFSVLSFVNEIALTPEQIAKVQEIEADMRSSIREAGKDSAVEQISEILRLNEVSARRKIEAVCTPQQLSALFHKMVQTEFSRGFQLPFQRQELIAYLALQPEDAEKVRLKAKECAKQMQDFELEWNKRIFGELLAALPKESQTKMKQVFFLMPWE